MRGWVALLLVALFAGGVEAQRMGKRAYNVWAKERISQVSCWMQCLNLRLL